MREITNLDQHYTGTFNVSGEEITGELIHNEEKGTILLNLVKQVTDAHSLGVKYIYW